MPLTIPQYDYQGKPQGTVTVSATYFKAKANPALFTQALRIYQSNQRQVTRKVKTRGEIDRTTQKVWRQKGTGRARHGSRRAPIFVGGGVAHGPTGQENFRLALPQKMRRAALKTALSDHYRRSSLKAILDLTPLKGKTKPLIKLFSKMELYPQCPKVLLILDSPYPEVLRAGRNLEWLSVSQAKRLNLFEVLNHQALVFTTKALDQLT